MRTLVWATALVATAAHAGNINVIYYNGVKADERYGAPKHFTGEKTYRDLDSGKVQIREQWVDGVLDGPFAHYEPDGTLDESGSNRAGKRHGVFRRYQHGKLQMEFSYVDGETAGVQKMYRDGVLQTMYLMDPVTHGRDAELEFNKQGQLTRLKCGKSTIGKQDLEWCGMNGKQSTVTIYNDAGKTRGIEQYLWGKKHGEQKTFNTNTGAVMQDEQYAHGERVGGQRNDPSGAALFKSDCDDKRTACSETEMFPGGKETKLVTVWKGGKLAERTERFQNGKVREHVVADGTHFKIDRFDDEGTPQSKGTYVHAFDSWQPYVVDGSVEYYSRGVLWRREKLVMGSHEGLSQAWWKIDAHAIREDSEYAKDQVVRQKIFVDDKPAVELEYMPDGSLKSRHVIALPPGVEI